MRHSLPWLILFAYLTLPGSLAHAGKPPSTQAAADPGRLSSAESGFVRLAAAARQSAAAGKARPGLARNATTEPSTAKTAAVRTLEPVLTSVTTGPGQAGYVHYFNVKMPDGSLESQIGIELPDQRIAWSFPELGVVVSPFIESGSLTVNGKLYDIEHLYAIRPFPDAEAMRVLQEDLLRRIIPWVEDQTPYCFLPGEPGYFCVSCLGFVMRVLFPGRAPAYAALPDDFQRTGNTYYTTDDLLLYLVGMHGLPTPEARRQRLERLSLPQSLRDEALRLVDARDAAPQAGAPESSTPQSPSGKTRPAVPPNSKLGQPRLPPGGKL